MANYMSIRVRIEDYQAICEVQRAIKNMGIDRAGQALKVTLDPDVSMTKMRTIRLCAKYTLRALRWGL